MCVVLCFVRVVLCSCQLCLLVLCCVVFVIVICVCVCVCVFSVTVECWRLHGASGKSLLSSSPLSASLRASPCVFVE